MGKIQQYDDNVTPEAQSFKSRTAKLSSYHEPCSEFYLILASTCTDNYLAAATFKTNSKIKDNG
jgi:hypothetical protein